MRRTPGSSPSPVPRTRAGLPPCSSTQRRISSWSVVVRGRLQRLTDHERNELGDLPLHSWVPTPKAELLVLLPAEVTGRRFLLRRGPDADLEIT